MGRGWARMEAGRPVGLLCEMMLVWTKEVTVERQRRTANDASPMDRRGWGQAQRN